MDFIYDIWFLIIVFNIVFGVWFCIKILIIFVKYICDMWYMFILWVLVIVNLKKINLLGLLGE